MALLNELLEEAAQRCTELTENADRALIVLEETLAGAEQLAETIESATGDTRERLSDLASQMEDAESDLESQANETGSALDALARRAEEAQDGVREVLSRVRTGLETLHAGQQALVDRFNPQTEEAEQQANDALERMAELQKLLGTELESANQAVEAFRQGLDQAREEWEARVKDFGEAFEALDESLREKTSAYSTEIADILDNQRVGVLVERLTNEMLIDSHNAAVDQLGLHYETEVPQAAEEGLARVQEALTGLERVCGEHASALRGKWVEISAKASEARETFAALLPVVQDAQQIP